MAIGAGLLAGVVVSTVLTTVAGPEVLVSWGWRIPFLLALPIGLIGLYLRTRLADSPLFAEIEDQKKVERSPLRSSMRHDSRGIVLAVALISGLTVSSSLFLIYPPSYLTTIVKLPQSHALACTAVAVLTYCASAPLFALLTDVIGRRRVLAAASALAVALAYPAYVLMASGSALAAGAALATLAALTAMANAAALPLIVELFATTTRFASLGIGWNIAAALFGGAAPLIATSLIAATGNPASPAFYVIVGSALSTIAAFVARETAGIELRAHAARTVETSPTLGPITAGSVEGVSDERWSGVGDG